MKSSGFHFARFVLCALTVALFSSSARAQEVVDLWVATINNAELITYSDVMWQLALEPDKPLDPPRPTDFQGALDNVINQRLIAIEAGKLPQINSTDKEVDDEIARLIKFFPSSADFYARFRRVGLNGDQVRDIVRQRVQIEKYIDFRFRSFTIVTDKDIADYYRDVFVPRFQRQRPGVIVPKLDDVRARLRDELVERRVESEVTAFLEDARTRADIIIFDTDQQTK
jgi:hypothetical protein